MSRKDYIKIADVLRKTRALNYLQNSKEIEQHIMRIERELCIIFSADNPRFDVDRFSDAATWVAE